MPKIAVYAPQPGWIERDADEMQVRGRWTAREAIRLAGIEATGKFFAVAITNQWRETTIVWNRRTGRPDLMGRS